MLGLCSQASSRRRCQSNGKRHLHSPGSSGKHLPVELIANARTSVSITFMIDLSPALPVVCQPKDSSSSIHKIGTEKNVTMALIARQLSYSAESPLFTFSHPWPPSFDRNIAMPLWRRHQSPISPLFFSLHVSLLSVDRKTPSP